MSAGSWQSALLIYIFLGRCVLSFSSGGQNLWQLSNVFLRITMIRSRRFLLTVTAELKYFNTNRVHRFRLLNQKFYCRQQVLEYPVYLFHSISFVSVSQLSLLTLKEILTFRTIREFSWVLGKLHRSTSGSSIAFILQKFHVHYLETEIFV